MNEFKPHDYFKADDKGYISRKVFIEHVRNTYDHMRELAELIKGYDQTIDSYLERWDQNLESLDDSIIGLLHEWIDDSTFATIINEEFFKTKADQVDLENVTAQLQQTEQSLNAQLANIENFENFEVNDKGRGKEEGAIIVFISDDASNRDYTMTYPLFKRNGVPFCLAVIPNNVMNMSNYMDLEELLEVEADGNEIMSHTFNHSRLPELSNEDAEFEFRESKKWLIEHGFVVNNFAVPFGDWGTREKYLAKKYYRSSRVSDYGDGMMNIPPVEMHELKSLWIGEGRTNIDDGSGYEFDTFENFKYYIDEANEQNALLIISMHGSAVNSGGYEPMVEQVIQYAKANARIMTLNDALNEYGNLIEIGDYSRQDVSKDHFAVSHDGKISTNNLLTKYKGHDNVDVNARTHTFEDATISMYTISASYARDNNFPISLGGKLYVERVAGISNSFSKQIYNALNGQQLQRHWDTSIGEWNPWVELKTDNDIVVLDRDSVANDTLPNFFNAKISTVELSRLFVSDSAYPGDVGGALITYRLNSNSYTYQELHTLENQKYVRQAVNNTTWGPWENYSKIHLKSLNQKNENTPISEYDSGITMIRVTGWSIGNGLVTTHKIGSNQYDKQEFRKTGGNEVYSRTTNSSGEWEVWEKISAV